MTRLDLRESPITVDELLRLASADPVVIVNRDGNEFFVEPADAFDREVTQLGRSADFMKFLADCAKEPGSISLDEIERRLDAEAR